MSPKLKTYLESQGYTDLKLLSTGEVAGVLPMMHTVGLFVGITEISYHRRFCFENIEDARDSIETWDGVGDPPGNWIKEKPSNRMNPRWAKGV